MENRYEQMPEEKRAKLLGASCKVFGKDGYDKASINTIIKEAEFSKGLLYHYFESKFQLYENTLVYVTDIIMEKLLQRVDKHNSDFIQRIIDITSMKMELFKRDPNIYAFLLSVALEGNKDVKKLVLNYTQELREISYGIIYDNLDYSYFREGINPQIAIESMLATIEAWGERYRHQHSEEFKVNGSIEFVMKELKPYFDFFYKSYYKNPPEEVEA